MWRRRHEMIYDTRVLIVASTIFDTRKVTSLCFHILQSWSNNKPFNFGSYNGFFCGHVPGWGSYSAGKLIFPPECCVELFRE